MSRIPGNVRCILRSSNVLLSIHWSREIVVQFAEWYRFPDKLSLSFSFFLSPFLLLNYFPRGSALSCANRAKYVKVREIRWILCNAEWMIFLGRGFLSATCGMYEDFPCPGTSFVDTFQKNIFLCRCFFLLSNLRFRDSFTIVRNKGFGA